MKVPKSMIAVRDGDPMIFSDDVSGYRQDGLGIHSQPRHLEKKKI